MKSLNSDSCANTLSELEKEDRRILTDAKYRKNWKAKQKRILAKATVEDVLYEKYYDLIERAKKLKIYLVYPVSVWGDALEIDNYAFKLAEHIWEKSESFSGNVTHQYKFNPYCSVRTVTSKGEQYSSRCTYRKTDATHYFKFTIDGIKNLMKLPKEVVNASWNDGLPLIAASNIKGRTAECVWVKGTKKLSDESGAIAWDYFKDDCVIFHGKTVQSAKIGLNKKIQILVEQEKNRQRRLDGLPPLWKERIKVSDIRPLTGWCLPGIRQWISKFMGGNKSVADWSEVAQAALKDTSYYGSELCKLLGANVNGPYTF